MFKSRMMIFSGLGGAVVTAGLVLSTSLANAQVLDQPFSGLVEAVSKKFNLNESEVQAVFDQYHQQHRQDMLIKMKEKHEERLSRLVSEGTLTEAQKQALIQKMDEMQKQFEANQDVLKDMTPEQRRAEMQKRHEELKIWAQSQGIDLDAISPMQFKMKKMGRGMRHMQQFEEKLEVSPTSQS